MSSIALLVAVSVLIGAFSYYTNAGFGDRRPRDKRREKRKHHASAADDGVPPPSK